MARAHRMRSDWGNVTQVRKGVWRLRYWSQTATGYRRCSETIRGTRRQAGERLAELRLQHAQDAPCPTVEECWTHWYLPDRERMVDQGDLARQSLIQYKSTWNRHVRMRWSDTQVVQVRPLEVQQWLFGLKRIAAKSSLQLMRQILDYPTRYGIISTNPLAIRYLLPSSATTTHRDDGVWSPAELGDVWRACWGTWIEPAMLLAGFGGCRVGEALGARAGDLQFASIGCVPIVFVRIKRQIDAQGRETNRTKNRWSNRWVLLAGCPARRLWQLRRNACPEEYLTHPSHRRFATQKELRTYFAERLLAHGVEYHLFKNLRKTWQTNTRWVLRLPPWVIEPMMGHVGEGVTGRHYDRPSEQVLASMLADVWQEHPFADAYDWLAALLR